MIYVVNEASEKILYKVDAWEIGGESKACRWAQDNGYTCIRQSITAMGDMIIWVR